SSFTLAESTPSFTAASCMAMKPFMVSGIAWLKSPIRRRTSSRRAGKSWEVLITLPPCQPSVPGRRAEVTCDIFHILLFDLDSLDPERAERYGIHGVAEPASTSPGCQPVASLRPSPIFA